MIPKVIHYCWLSGDPLPKKMKWCWDSWQRVLPDYRFVLWDWNRAPKNVWTNYWFAKKNYAFAADFIRLWALWNEGGIYLDTDVEVIKPFDDLLNRDLLLGEEDGTGYIEEAVMGAVKGDETIKRVLDSFDVDMGMIAASGKGTENNMVECEKMETLPQRMQRVLKKVGDNENFEILPSDYFSPKDWRTGEMQVTNKTFTIHHFTGSWKCPKERAAQWCGIHLGGWSIPVARWIGHRIEKVLKVK